ncbi:hypothetical protein ADIAL_1179 [Alkalibacterium sp. AK22]|uniref:TIGR02679 domain-containing protein n=1 Tax=Alkalibacterium sp. AK22 TaxID=1229520 RepID=UPI0004483BEB|nr:TIGR02679 domain-containing protein [Alkalibacterium sp. AK22]EXJ23374.1 hypothetical protein ADIAL_1179 [Alkalibacterium sp. AK22]
MTNIYKAVDFFRTQPGMNRLFWLFRDELLKHRRIKGTVSILDFSVEELESLAHFFQVSIDSLRDKGTVDLEAFNRKLDSPPFNGLDLIQLLEYYYDETLLSLETKEQRKTYLKRLEHDFSLVKDWLAYLGRATSDTRWIHEIIAESSHQFEQYVLYLSEGVRLLPSRPIRLSVFSQIITLDADAFQPTSPLGKLWLHVLAETERLHAVEPVTLPTSREAEDDLLESFNLFREDITDTVTVANCFAETQKGYQPVWEAAVHTQSVLSVPLREVIKLIAVYPAHEKGIVWLVDDPELFTRLLDEIPWLPMISINRSWSCAVWEVFDRIQDSGFQMRYIGDFTPESLTRAEELLLHYTSDIRVWKLDSQTYQQTIDSSLELSDEECRLLDRHQLDYLAEVKESLRHIRKPGYMIRILEDLVASLKRVYTEDDYL